MLYVAVGKKKIKKNNSWGHRRWEFAIWIIGFVIYRGFVVWYAVTLSKTKKKGREHKESIVNSIRDAVEKYNSIYVFSFENMRNLKFKEFREQHKLTSR